MKIKLLRYILALFLCGTTTMAMADNDDNYCVNEDFSTFPSGGSASYNNTYNGWSIRGGRIENPSGSTSTLYKIEDKNSNVGYATTPALNYSGSVILLFRYGTNKNTSTITISVNGEAKFADNSKSEDLTIANRTDGNLLSTSYTITSVTTNTKISFTQKSTSDYFYIDDVKVIKLGEITLNEGINSSEAIEVNDKTSCTVRTVRTLQENIWNTMCLPFAVNKETLAAAWETSVELRTYSGYSNNTMSFSSADNVTAGTPFLIKVGKTITNPTFESVTISNAADTIINHDGVKFIGTYSGRDLNTDGTHLFITTTGTVAKPSDDSHNHLKGLRAYIDLTDCPSPVRLNIDGETMDIQQVAIDEERPDALYDLKGQRLQSPKKGIIIKDGKLIFTK